MAAKLEWDGTYLVMGAFRLGQVVDVINIDPRAYRFVIGGKENLSQPYESIVACMEDLESEIRRLLKEAGAEVQP